MLGVECLKINMLKYQFPLPRDVTLFRKKVVTVVFSDGRGVIL